MSYQTCRFCNTALRKTFVDLGMAPMVSAYLSLEQCNLTERFYPLHAYVCEKCLLVQLPEAETPESIFGEYPYFSSVSKSWLEHARDFADLATRRFSLSAASQVVEIASNDGYLLQYFKEKGIRIQGVEPARNIARTAIEKGIPTLAKFFGQETAQELADAGKMADLVVGNNVLAHVPNIRDFVSGLKRILKPKGVISLEFPHLLRTMIENQFDQVFHEHFSYLSLNVVERVLSAHSLAVFDVQEIGTHGGSIRVFAKHSEDNERVPTPAVEEMRVLEREAGLESLDAYQDFSRKVQATKRSLLRLLVNAKEEGCSIVGYGAPGKGCVMLNYCGVREDFLDYLVDLSAAKQGRYMPGVHLPILHPDRIKETKPDYVLILPWNLKEEIMEQLSYIREWGGKFIVPIPNARVIE